MLFSVSPFLKVKLMSFFYDGTFLLLFSFLGVFVVFLVVFFLVFLVIFCAVQSGEGKVIPLPFC